MPMPCARTSARPCRTACRSARPTSASVDRALLLLRREVGAHQVLRLFGGGALREVDDVDRAPCLRGPGSGSSRGAASRRTRSRAGTGRCARADRDRRRAGELRERLLEPLVSAERRAHQEEARVLRDEERHLPRDAALSVGVVVELVHHDVVDVGVRALRGAPCWPGSRRCSRRWARRGSPLASPVSIPTSSAPKRSQSAKNFSLDQRLDGARVERRARPRARARKMAAVATSDLPEPVGVARMTLLAVDDLEDRLLLRRVELEPRRLHVVEEAVEHVPRAHVVGARRKMKNLLGERGCHCLEEIPRSARDDFASLVGCKVTSPAFPSCGHARRGAAARRARGSRRCTRAR